MINYLNRGGPAPVCNPALFPTAIPPVPTPTATVNAKALVNPAVFGCADICVPHDGEITQADLTCLIDYAFGGAPAPSPLWAADVNGDGIASSEVDVVYMINYLNRGGASPACNPSLFATSTLVPKPGSKPAINGCGDICVPKDGFVDSADYLCLIDFAFNGADEPSPIWNADVNGDGIASNIADVTYLKNYIDRLGPELKCDSSKFGVPTATARPTDKPASKQQTSGSTDLGIPPLPDGSKAGSADSGSRTSPDAQVANSKDVKRVIPNIVPVEPSGVRCVDSDGGANYYVKGQVSYGARRLADYCAGSSVIEYYCEASGVKIASNACRFGCNNGACRDKPLDAFSALISGMGNFLGSLFR